MVRKNAIEVDISDKIILYNYRWGNIYKTLSYNVGNNSYNVSYQKFECDGDKVDNNIDDMSFDALGDAITYYNGLELLKMVIDNSGINEIMEQRYYWLDKDELSYAEGTPSCVVIFDMENTNIFFRDIEYVKGFMNGVTNLFQIKNRDGKYSGDRKLDENLNSEVLKFSDIDSMASYLDGKYLWGYFNSVRDAKLFVDNIRRDIFDISIWI